MIDSSQSGVIHGESAPRMRVEWRSSFAVRNSMIVLASIAMLWALQWGSVFIVPCIVAVCMTFWLMPLVDRLQRMHIPRSIGSALVIAALMGAIGFTAYALRDDAREFAAGLPKAAHHARVIVGQAEHDPNGWLHHLRNTLNERPIVEPKMRAAPTPAESTTDIQDAFVRGSTTALAVAANIGVVLFLIYLMLASGDLFRRKLLVVISNQITNATIPASSNGQTAVTHVPGRLSRKRITVEILNEIGAQFQRYLAALAVTNAVIGVLTWAAFSALGVEHAAVWGAAAAILHIVPYVGPAVIAVASFLVTALQFDSLSQAFLVALTAVMIFGLIGMFLTTWLASRASKMNSVAVFVGLMFWGWLWGIPGLLLGTPLMMATKVMADRIDCLNWLGTFLGDAPKREHKAAQVNTTHSRDENVFPDATSASALTPNALSRVELTESAAFGDSAFVAPEVASETIVIARDESRISRDLCNEEMRETPTTKLFGAPPLPA